MEDADVGGVRWLLDYHASLHLTSWLHVHAEVVLGQQDGKGLADDTGRPDPDSPAEFYGGELQGSVEAFHVGDDIGD